LYEDRLPDAFSVYPYEFSNKLRGLVEIRLIDLGFPSTNCRAFRQRRIKKSWKFK
jgi:hypothetical protein